MELDRACLRVGRLAAHGETATGLPVTQVCHCGIRRDAFAADVRARFARPSGVAEGSDSAIRVRAGMGPRLRRVIREPSSNGTNSPLDPRFPFDNSADLGPSRSPALAAVGGPVLVLQVAGDLPAAKRHSPWRSRRVSSTLALRLPRRGRRGVDAGADSPALSVGSGSPCQTPERGLATSLGHSALPPLARCSGGVALLAPEGNRPACRATAPLTAAGSCSPEAGPSRASSQFRTRPTAVPKLAKR